MKINQLIALAEDPSLKLSQKVEQVNSDPLSLSILFLLMDKKEEFKQIFPVKEVVADLTKLEPFYHEKVNQELFRQLVKIEDFVFNSLKDEKSFERFNEISSGALVQSLNESLDEEDFISRVVDSGLLSVYLKNSIFDNGFIHAKVSEDTTLKIVDFVKENSHYFTEEYFNGLERIHDIFKPYIALMVYPSFKDQSFSNFHSKYLSKNKELFLNQIAPVLTPNHLTDILTEETLYKEYLYNESSEDSPVLFEKIAQNLDSLISKDSSSNFLSRLTQIVDSEIVYAKLLTKVPLPLIKEIFKNESHIPKEITIALDGEKITNGDYSSIDDLGSLNNYNLDKKTLIKAAVAYMKNKSFKWVGDFEDLSCFEEIKLDLAEACLKENVLKKEDYIKFDLSKDWYIEKFGLSFYLEECLDNDEEAIKPLIPLYKKELEKIFKKKIKKEDHWRKGNLIKLAKELDLIDADDLFKMVLKDEISLDSEYILSFNEEQIAELFEKEEHDKLKFLISPHLDIKIKNQLIGRMKAYDITSSYRKYWLELPLDDKKLQKIWDKVKEKDNRDLKDLMFDLLSFQGKNMSESLKEEILGRSKKLKGFEELDISENNNDKTLGKKFSKEIGSAAGALAALKNEAFTSILDEKNLDRIANKVAKDSRLVSKWLEDKSLVNYLTKERVDILVPEVVEASTLGKILDLPISDEAKIYFIKKTNNSRDPYFDRGDIYCSPLVVHTALNHFNSTRVLFKMNDQSINDFINSSYWTRIFILNHEEYSSKLSPDLITQLVDEMGLHKNSSEMTKILENIFELRELESFMIPIIIKHSQEYSKDILEKSKNIDLSKEDFRLLYSNTTNDNVSLETLFYYKSAFNSSEFIEILKGLTDSQLKEAFERSYNTPDLKILDASEFDALLCDRNLSKIPASYWKAYSILDKKDLNFEELEDFLKDSTAFAKLSLLNKQQKEEFLKKISSMEISLVTLDRLFELQDLLGYATEDLEKLIFKLNGAGITYLLTNIEKYKKFLSNISDDSKSKLLEILAKEDKEIVNLNELLFIVPKNNPLRLDLIKKCISESELNEVLGIEGLTDLELLAISENAVKHNLGLILNYAKNEYQGPIINHMVSKEYWNFTESKNQIVIKVGGIEVAQMGDKPMFIGSLTSENKRIIETYFTKLVEELPAVIKGEFFIKEQIFVPSEALSDFVKEKIQTFSSISSFTQEDILKSLMKFGAVSKIKAIAKRTLSSSNKPLYRLELILDESLIKNTKKNYSEDLINILKDKEQNIKSYLNKHLTPNQDRTFGFELEFSANRAKDTVAKKIREQEVSHGVSVKNTYTSSSGRTWDLKMDGSVKAVNGYAMELASPILSGEEGVKESKEVLNSIFNEFKIVTGQNTNGGLHVHHDIKDIKKQTKSNNEILKSFYAFQESLFALCDYWRQENTFCRKIDFELIDSDKQVSSRFVGFNITEYGTMEFRMRENLEDSDSIIRWILITQKVVDSAYLSLRKQEKEFIKMAEETLSVIEREKMLQLKKLKDEEALEHLENFKQAQIYAKMVINP